MSKWLPIESAPKDGRRIIGYWGGVEPHCETVFWNRGLGRWWGDDDGYNYGPTHWMPLPDPPAEG